MEPNEARAAILLVVSQIPAGKVATYGQIAEMAGLPGKSRLVGRVMSQLPSGSDIPWHRVVNASGRISLPEASGGFKRQYKLLEKEGVKFNGKRVSLPLYRW